ncbi:MAG: hypothetical protein GF344_13595 [Chitinivibrionales bacterium]|nr:hypothetical protein [Chitinivibrionales bacterium]MBD3357764.1 hypothetical protein [Chitinivibrionales bacterium]
MNQSEQLLAKIAGLVLLTVGTTVAVTEMVQPRRLINGHTAGLLPRGHYEFETRVYPSRHDAVDGAGVTFSFGVGITDRLMFGGGYGADGMIGRGTLRGNPWPGLLFKYRIVEEKYHVPGIAIGFDWQGFGGIEGYQNTEAHYRGYVFKSQGAFVALSKNYLLMKSAEFGLHGSVNFSVEDLPRIQWPNGVVGFDFGANEELAVVVEYDLALNQRDPAADGDDTGYTNPLKGFLCAGIRWAFAPAFYIEFNVMDLLENKLRRQNQPSGARVGWSRELKLVYLSNF